ncbi:MAG: hypothetical protein N2Z20_04605 [Elusimicrobiales bacterium]|nr:hypothetical protein [Elusimicrobiales bacterium]
MKLLTPYLVKNMERGFVDEWQIWVNTNNVLDLAFFELLEKNFEKIKLIQQPRGVINGNASINDFYKFCCDEDSIYIKFDDDIVWLEPDFFVKFLDFRITNKDFFLVFPLTINNAVCSHILQQLKKIKNSNYIRANALDDIGWKDPYFAEKLHLWFLEKIRENSFNDLFFDYTPIALNRFSINCFAWFGNEFKKFGGVIEGDDEEALSVHKVMEIKKSNCIYGSAIVSHFAFYTQREYLDNTKVLYLYEQILKNDKELNSIFNKVNLIANSVDNKDLISSKMTGKKIK